MIICGIKITHDGAVALIKDGKLEFSTEIEKLDNNPRFSEIEDLSHIPSILGHHGYSVEEVDYFVIDGWEGLRDSTISTQNLGVPTAVPVASYRENTLNENILETRHQGSLKLGNARISYTSYMHVAGHIFGAYCSSPFAKRGESSYILVWDGGMFPRLYYFDPMTNQLENFGKLFYIIGNFYEQFSLYFQPFSKGRGERKLHLDVAGKVMAYIAKGEAKKNIIDDMEEIYHAHLDISTDFVHQFARKFKSKSLRKGYRDEDTLASVHVFLQNLLLRELMKKVDKYKHPSRNLCYSGGCSLNIKWNSAIRREGIFEQIWVPPFANDAGSAIGAACCEMVHQGAGNYLDWTVYSGPKLKPRALTKGWKSRGCDIAALAVHLHEVGEPVVFLNGQAELGPRALGNRSILAPAIDPDMKSKLNYVKKREEFRPVAPICLEEFSSKVFDPGGKDPYMVFDHSVLEEWRSKVPAICHLDGTARVQTLSEGENPIVHDLIKRYHKLSGIPLLCNTSANHKGQGFFPDVKSAMDWGRLNYIWSEGVLYEKELKVELSH